MLEFVLNVDVARAVVGGGQQTIDCVRQATIDVSDKMNLC